MKRFLSVILSLSLLGSLPWNASEAKTNFIKDNRAVVYESKGGKELWIQGENLPHIYINNKNEAIANAHGGGSSFLKTMLTLIKFVVGVAAVGYAISLVKSLGQGLSTGMRDFASYLRNLVNSKNTNTNDGKGSQNAPEEEWISINNFLNNIPAYFGSASREFKNPFF